MSVVHAAGASGTGRGRRLPAATPEKTALMFRPGYNGSPSVQISCMACMVSMRLLLGIAQACFALQNRSEASMWMIAFGGLWMSERLSGRSRISRADYCRKGGTFKWCSKNQRRAVIPRGRCQRRRRPPSLLLCPRHLPPVQCRAMLQHETRCTGQHLQSTIWTIVLWPC